MYNICLQPFMAIYVTYINESIGNLPSMTAYVLIITLLRRRPLPWEILFRTSLASVREDSRPREMYIINDGSVIR